MTAAAKWNLKTLNIKQMCKLILCDIWEFFYLLDKSEKGRINSNRDVERDFMSRTEIWFSGF